MKNKNYSDNLDEYHLEAPKRRRKQNTPSRLCSPSKQRVEAQHKIQTENRTRSVLGTAIKDEEKEENPGVKLEEDEMRCIEARNKERNKHKKWPDDARLVHIDSTACSLDCMKNSDYHKDIDETEYNQINQQKQQEKLTAATPEGGDIVSDQMNIGATCPSPRNEVQLDQNLMDKSEKQPDNTLDVQQKSEMKLDAATVHVELVQRSFNSVSVCV